jgi:quinol monooxygenase YgiN
MVVEYTRYRIGKERQEAFEEAYKGAQTYQKASPNCVNYELSHYTEETERYVLRIEWVSAERHLKGFRQETSFKKFFEFVQPFMSSIEEMQHYELTDVVGSGAARDEKNRWREHIALTPSKTNQAK